MCCYVAPLREPPQPLSGQQDPKTRPPEPRTGRGRPQQARLSSPGANGAHWREAKGCWGRGVFPHKALAASACGHRPAGEQRQLHQVCRQCCCCSATPWWRRPRSPPSCLANYSSRSSKSAAAPGEQANASGAASRLGLPKTNDVLYIVGVNCRTSYSEHPAPANVTDPMTRRAANQLRNSSVLHKYLLFPKRDFGEGGEESRPNPRWRE